MLDTISQAIRYLGIEIAIPGKWRLWATRSVLWNYYIHFVTTPGPLPGFIVALCGVVFVFFSVPHWPGHEESGDSWPLPPAPL